MKGIVPIVTARIQQLENVRGEEGSGYIPGGGQGNKIKREFMIDGYDDGNKRDETVLHSYKRGEKP